MISRSTPSHSVSPSRNWSTLLVVWPTSPPALLRTPMAPEVAFSDDPLRMLRLHRFVATLGFTPDPAAEAAAQSMAGRLQIVSAERIRDEFTKLLTAPYPETALWGVVRSGLAAYFLPELVEPGDGAGPGAASQGRAGPQHRGDRVHQPRPGPEAGRPPPRHRQAGHQAVWRRWGELPPPRGGRGEDGEGEASSAALPPPGRRRSRGPGVSPSASPHLQDGMDRRRGAPLRARCRSSPRTAQRVGAVRRHHPQRAPGQGGPEPNR